MLQLRKRLLVLLALSVVATVLAFACAGSDEVGLTVDLRTDFVLGDEFSRVETLLADAPIGPATEARRVESTSLAGADFTAGQRVAEFADVGTGTRYLRVRLLRDDGGLVIMRDAIVEIERDTSITVVVSRRCSGLVCPAGGDPESFTACVGGSCVDPRCTPEAPEYCGEPECAVDGDCPSGVGCLASSCADGLCLSAPDDSLCGAGERCSADGACVADVMDSGVPDARRDTAPVDTGMDTGVDTGPTFAPNFCPEDGLLREEMAVFLVRYIHGTDFTPPPATGTFSDVPAGGFYAPWIEQLQRDGITNGCAVGMYCPSDVVRRDEAAVFFVRSIHGGSFTPRSASGTVFSDVPASATYADYIEQLERDGITNGCAVGRYCPFDDLTRAQAAVFIMRMVHGGSYTPPPAVGLFDDVPAADLQAPFIEQFAREGFTDGCVR